MLRFAADEASLLPISWLAFSVARFDRIDGLLANLRVSSVFAVTQEIPDSHPFELTDPAFPGAGLCSARSRLGRCHQ